MKIQNEQNKPHRKQMSIAQEFTVSFTIDNIWCYNSLHRKEFECMGYEFESPKWIWMYLTKSLTHNLSIDIGLQNELLDVQPTQTSSDNFCAHYMPVN